MRQHQYTPLACNDISMAKPRDIKWNIIIHYQHVRIPYQSWPFRSDSSQSLGKGLVNRRLQIHGQPEHLHIAKRQNLRANDPRNALLPITPPEQIRYASPPCRALGPSRGAAADHEGQAPTLRAVAWVQEWNLVDKIGLRGRGALAGEVGHFGDLVGEHAVHRGLLEDAGACCGGFAVVEEDGQDFCGVLCQYVLRKLRGEREHTAVLLRLRETSCATAVQAILDLSCGTDDQRASEEMIAARKMAIRGTLVHVSEILLHVLVGEHGDVLEAQGFEDVLVEVVIK